MTRISRGAVAAATYGGKTESTEENEGNEGLVFEAQIEPSFSELARESVRGCLL
jgi:hypothetical protein